MLKKLCVSVAGLALLWGCQEENGATKRGAPPPVPEKPATCAAGGGELSDSEVAPFFPRETGGFCLDPNGGDKAFGEDASLPLDRICDIFDGECEVYKGFKVRRVVQLRYVDGAGSTATIDINLSKFANVESAFGMFTKRTVGEGDPADDATPKPIVGEGAAALGIGNAYLWRGVYLAELTYNSETASAPEMRALGDKLLPPLVKAVGEKLPGDVKPPTAVGLLPSDNRLPMGQRFVANDVLSVDGVGDGAFGYYKEGDRRYRALVMARADEAQAKDVLRTLLKVEGAAEVKHIGDGAVRLMVGEGASAEWFIARKGRNLFGIGDEARVLRAGMSPEEHDKLCLDADAKQALLKSALTR